jgi:hypothetical protein
MSFGFTLSRHGFDTNGRGIEGEYGCGGKIIDRDSSH